MKSKIRRRCNAAHEDNQQAWHPTLTIKYNSIVRFIQLQTVIVSNLYHQSHFVVFVGEGGHYCMVS